MKSINTPARRWRRLLYLNFAAGAVAQNIVVGGKNFTEQQIMSQMTAQAAQAKGFKP